MEAPQEGQGASSSANGPGGPQYIAVMKDLIPHLQGLDEDMLAQLRQSNAPYVMVPLSSVPPGMVALPPAAPAPAPATASGLQAGRPSLSPNTKLPTEHAFEQAYVAPAGAAAAGPSAAGAAAGNHQQQQQQQPVAEARFVPDDMNPQDLFPPVGTPQEQVGDQQQPAEGDGDGPADMQEQQEAANGDYVQLQHICAPAPAPEHPHQQQLLVQLPEDGQQGRALDADEEAAAAVAAEQAGADLNGLLQPDQANGGEAEAAAAADEGAPAEQEQQAAPRFAVTPRLQLALNLPQHEPLQDVAGAAANALAVFGNLAAAAVPVVPAAAGQGKSRLDPVYGDVRPEEHPLTAALLAELNGIRPENAGVKGVLMLMADLEGKAKHIRVSYTAPQIQHRHYLVEAVAALRPGGAGGMGAAAGAKAGAPQVGEKRTAEQQQAGDEPPEQEEQQQGGGAAAAAADDEAEAAAAVAAAAAAEEGAAAAVAEGAGGEEAFVELARGQGFAVTKREAKRRAAAALMEALLATHNDMVREGLSRQPGKDTAEDSEPMVGGVKVNKEQFKRAQAMLNIKEHQLYTRGYQPEDYPRMAAHMARLTELIGNPANPPTALSLLNQYVAALQMKLEEEERNLHAAGPYRLQLSMVKDGVPLLSEVGVGRSKRDAKQTAAALLMNRALDTIEDFRAQSNKVVFDLERKKDPAAAAAAAKRGSAGSGGRSGGGGRGAGSRYGRDGPGGWMRGGEVPWAGPDARRGLQQMGASQGPPRDLAGGAPSAAGPGAPKRGMGGRGSAAAAAMGGGPGGGGGGSGGGGYGQAPKRQRFEEPFREGPFRGPMGGSGGMGGGPGMGFMGVPGLEGLGAPPGPGLGPQRGMGMRPAPPRPPPYSPPAAAGGSGGGGRGRGGSGGYGYGMAPPAPPQGLRPMLGNNSSYPQQQQQQPAVMVAGGGGGGSGWYGGPPQQQVLPAQPPQGPGNRPAWLQQGMAAPVCEGGGQAGGAGAGAGAAGSMGGGVWGGQGMGAPVSYQPQQQEQQQAAWNPLPPPNAAQLQQHLQAGAGGGGSGGQSSTWAAAGGAAGMAVGDAQLYPAAAGGAGGVGASVGGGGYNPAVPQAVGGGLSMAAAAPPATSSAAAAPKVVPYTAGPLYAGFAAPGDASSGGAAVPAAAAAPQAVQQLAQQYPFQYQQPQAAPQQADYSNWQAMAAGAQYAVAAPAPAAAAVAAAAPVPPAAAAPALPPAVGYGQNAYAYAYPQQQPLPQQPQPQQQPMGQGVPSGSFGGGQASGMGFGGRMAGSSGWGA